MAAPYDTARDVVIAGLRALALTTVTSELVSTFGAANPAVRSTHGFPIALDQLRSLKLPAMSVYVERARVLSVGRHRDHRLSVVFEYVMPPCGLDKMNARWPALRAVWTALLRSMVDGVEGTTTTPVTLEGEATPTTLQAVGITGIADETAECAFAFVAGGSETYPGFVARVEVTARDEAALDLVDLVALFARFDLHANGELSHNDLVSLLVTTSDIVPEQGGRFATESFDVVVKE